MYIIMYTYTHVCYINERIIICICTIHAFILHSYTPHTTYINMYTVKSLLTDTRVADSCHSPD